MPGELNGTMGMAEGYNGVTQGSTGASKGGDVNSTSMMSPAAGGSGSVLDAGTLMAIKAIMPALMAAKGQKNKVSSGPVATQGNEQKPMGQPQQGSVPRSTGGPGVSSVGNGANLAMIIKAILGGQMP